MFVESKFDSTDVICSVYGICSYIYSRVQLCFDIFLSRGKQLTIPWNVLVVFRDIVFGSSLDQMTVTVTGGE